MQFFWNLTRWFGSWYMPIHQSIQIYIFQGTGSWSKLHDWEKNELALIIKKPTERLVAKNPKLFDGDIGLKSSSKLGMEDKFDSTNVAIYFEKRMLQRRSVFQLYTHKELVATLCL
jgi:hypothetical protein